MFSKCPYTDEHYRITIRMTMHFEGYIKDVKYQAFLASDLQLYDYADFNVNTSRASGRIRFHPGEFAYSRWTSPKRTRTYPFERIYRTYNYPFRVTIIPIIKDEGCDGDLDRITYQTISLMNLLNIYIVLAYYDAAKKSMRTAQIARHKITKQELNNEFVKTQFLEISQYKQSALHWNRSLIEGRFAKVYRHAIDSYARLAQETGVKLHGRDKQEQYLAEVLRDFEHFKNSSMMGSAGASMREVQTIHQREYLSEGIKATLAIKNYLGGVYYLTADEIVMQGGRYLIQESKNSTSGFLPHISDIKDGLLKLILYSNLDSLRLKGEFVKFSSRLKLTGHRV